MTGQDQDAEARARRLARLTDQMARDDYEVDLDELAARIVDAAVTRRPSPTQAPVSSSPIAAPRRPERATRPLRPTRSAPLDREASLTGSAAPPGTGARPQRRNRRSSPPNF